MVDIKAIQELSGQKKIAVTKHARERLIERNISIDDIINGIKTGNIIKEYEDDKPLPSCLILGLSVTGKHIHIVASNDNEYVYLITAYYPSLEKWEDDFKTRKEQ